jgi:hypothetical protein
MKDDTGRPGNGEKVGLSGMRARNHTTVMGAAERVGAVMSRVETPAQTSSVADERDPLGLEASEDQGYVSPLGSHDDFQTLDELFAAVHDGDPAPSHDEPTSRLEPVGTITHYERDASSTRLGDLGGDDEFQSALDVFDPPAVEPPSFTAPKIVRSPSGQVSGQTQVAAADLFDPFESLDEDSHDSFPQAQDSTVVHLEDPAVGPDAVLAQEVTQPQPSPKIVRVSEATFAQENVIVPESYHNPGTAMDAPAEPEPVSSFKPVTSERDIEMEAESMTDIRDQIFWRSESPLVGFLVTYDHDPKGSYVELRQGRLIVSSQREDSGSCLVVAGESVSPMHAIMRVAPGGVLQVLDQLSETGTRVRHLGQADEEFLSGEKSALSHGDIVFFGDRKFHVLLVLGGTEES